MELRSIWRRLVGICSARKADADLQEEINAHLEAAAADFRGRGMSEEQAHRQARLHFGGITQIRESYREQHGWPWIASIAADIKFAGRQFGRSPGFFTVAVATLAIGLGTTTAIYGVLDSILLQPFPFVRQQELVKISGFYPKGWIKAVQQQTHSLQAVISYALPMEHNIVTSSGAERIFASTVSTNAFEVLGIEPGLGRLFLPEEAVAGRDKVVILSYGYWKQDFGADPHVIGRTLLIDGEQRTIIGVMPPNIAFPDANTRLWLPVSFKSGDPIDPWAQFSGQMIGRLRPGVTVGQAQAEMRTLHPGLLKLFPWPMPDNWYADVTVMPLLDSVVGDIRPKLLLLFSAVALVMLIACANVANLLLSRANTLGDHPKPATCGHLKTGHSE